MIYKILLTSLILLFSACSSKSVTYDKTSELEEANKCRVLNTKDLKIKCYNKISENNSFAQIRLAKHLITEKKYLSAKEYISKAYKKENPYSSFLLAYLHTKGLGVKQDLNKAFKLLEDSSNIDPNSAFQLAGFYMNGITVDKNVPKAMELLNNSASKNLKNAQKTLIRIYENSLFGIEKNEEKLNFWREKLKDKEKSYDYLSL